MSPALRQRARILRVLALVCVGGAGVAVGRRLWTLAGLYAMTAGWMAWAAEGAEADTG